MARIVTIVRIIYWFFFITGAMMVAVGLLITKTTFERAVLLWFSGFIPMIGGTMAHLLLERWEKGWREFFETALLLFPIVYGVFGWPYSYIMYREAIDYYHTKQWYASRGINYPEEVMYKESLWEFLFGKKK